MSLCSFLEEHAMEAMPELALGNALRSNMGKGRTVRRVQSDCSRSAACTGCTKPCLLAVGTVQDCIESRSVSTCCAPLAREDLNLQFKNSSGTVVVRETRILAASDRWGQMHPDGRPRTERAFECTHRENSGHTRAKERHPSVKSCPQPSLPSFFG